LEALYGVVPLGSIFYIKPDNIESECQRVITEEYGLLRIQAPRRMGKTSLLGRLADYAQGSKKYRVVRIDLQQAEHASL
jgi:hypothetical protein